MNWESVMGAPPEQRQDQPRVPFFREFGSIDEGFASLELRISPGRVDWLLSPIVPMVEGQSEYFKYFKGYDEFLARFEQLLFAKAFEAYKDAIRVAVGVIAVHPTASQQASYGELAELLPAVEVPRVGVTEFLFQVNRPRASTTMANASLNRLSRWSCAAVAGFQVAPVAGVLQATTATPFYETRVELDLSTPADNRQPIGSDVNSKVTVELFKLASEILVDGDKA
jgi:hypothetical protein